MPDLVSPRLAANSNADRRTLVLVALTLVGWATAVVSASLTGALASLYQPLIGGIVALTILVPVLCYFASPDLQSLMHGIGHRRIAQFHIWRIPAALLFFWYGVQGALPTLFWTLAGIGDFIAGTLALMVATGPQTTARYTRFHLFGFADFVIAVGTGLTFTLLVDPRMLAITALPLVLIPLFGVGLSGATHLIAFDMLGKGRGFKSPVAA